MGFTKSGLSVEGGFEDGGDGAEKLPVNRYNLGGLSDRNVYNSLEKMPVQVISFPGIEKTRVDSQGERGF